MSTEKAAYYSMLAHMREITYFLVVFPPSPMPKPISFFTFVGNEIFHIGLLSVHTSF